MKKRLKFIFENISLLTEDAIKTELINLLHEEYKQDMLPLFIRIQQLDKEQVENEKRLLYGGLEDAMHNMVNISRYLLEEKTSRQAKDSVKFMFESNNIAYLIRVMMAYFPNATSKGASNSGKWVFDKFIKLVLDNRHKYQKGGNDRTWLQNMKYDKYIDLILEKY